MRSTYFIITILLFGPFSKGQSLLPGHSHNDYEQSKPFKTAYKNDFASIEADIHFKNGQLYVCHNADQLNPSRTLEKMYLIPLSKVLGKSRSQKIRRKLQLLIDVKTEAITTLDALIRLLQQFPSITKDNSITICISGNRPNPIKMVDYPNYISFDGRPYETYTELEWKKIAMVSDNFMNYQVKPNNSNASIRIDTAKIRDVIHAAHQRATPIRFWGNPDDAIHWEFLWNEGVDYINTDHIEKLHAFLLKKKSLKE